MPFRRQISDLDRSISELRASIEAARGADGASVEKLLGELARLRSERLRLMERHFVSSK